MIRIMTDTSANLPAEIIKKYNIGVVSFTYTIDGVEQSVPKNGDFDGKSYYDAMRDGSDIKTSMINSAAYGDAFCTELNAGRDIIYFGMSGGISGSISAAKDAADELRNKYPDRKIAVIDTLAASLGEGLTVLNAAKMAAEEASFDDIVRDASVDVKKMRQFFTVDNINYIKKGGRLSAAAAFIGSMLNIKPILKGDDEGKIVLCGKVRGMKSALDALAEKYKALAADTGRVIGIAHADCKESAAYLAKKLRELGQKAEILINCYEPVTGAHVGPGTVALFFYDSQTA